MSTRNAKRTRPQKYKNRTAFKNDLHDKTPQMKLINSLHVCEVCDHCKSVIEWKIKYKKYKPLTQPKTCIKCKNRNVIKAYHVLCRDCAKKDKICAKCLKSGEQVRIEPPQPTEEEQIKLKVEMDRLIKSLPERKRRSFLRYMKKGKHENVENLEDADGKDIEEKDTVEGEKKLNRIPHTRDELLQKIEELKVGDDDDDEDDYEDEDDSDLDDLSEEDEEETKKGD